MWFADGTIIKYESDTSTLVIDAVREINVKAAGPINVKSTGPINIIAESDVFVEGTIYVTEDVVANGVSLVHHVHTCPHGGTTSEPN